MLAGSREASEAKSGLPSEAEEASGCSTASAANWPEDRYRA